MLLAKLIFFPQKFQQVEKPIPVAINPQGIPIYGYMYISNGSPRHPLDLESYFNGRQNESYQRRYKEELRISGKIIGIDTIYFSKQALIKAFFGNRGCPPRGGRYILAIGYPLEEAEKMIVAGRFHEMMVEATHFEDEHAHYVDQIFLEAGEEPTYKLGPLEVISNPHFVPPAQAASQAIFSQ